MVDSLEKQAEKMHVEERKAGEGNALTPMRKQQGAPEYGGYLLAFLLGCVITVAIRYMLRGVSIQLSPESFVSLVFTIAVGAASLVLAIVAISYGRVSERVMTE